MEIFQPASHATYQAAIQFTGEILGGLPQSPSGSNCLFHRLGSHRALHARQVKACLKEAAAQLLLDKKGFAKSVYVEPDLFRLEGGEQLPALYVQRKVETNSGATLSEHMYERLATPAAFFEVLVNGDYLSNDDWARIWKLAGELGIGAFASRNYGQFRLTQWEQQ